MLEGFSTAIELPEKVDVVVSEVSLISVDQSRLMCNGGARLTLLILMWFDALIA